MKNSTFFPFERNKYFYGKLLSVDDFELEQKYVNDKRRMINRFVCGTGIVAGMYVVGVDEQTISVEMGCALDAFGREIVVDTPVIRKLSLLDGFDSCADMHDNYMYLCVEYDEKETNPVHNIAGSSGAVQEMDRAGYSRIREGYHLYLVSQEPEEPNLSYRALYEESVVVFEGQDISVKQTFPRFAESGRDVEVRVDIENLGQQYISFSYNLELTCLSWEGEARLTVSFDEMLYEKSGTYSLTYHLKAAEVSGVEGAAEVGGDSFRLFVSKQPADARAGGKSTVRIAACDVKEELLRTYHQTAMERVQSRGYKEKLYLARIYMVKAGDTYIIARIENAPFGQYVTGGELSVALEAMMIGELSRSRSLEGDDRNRNAAAGGDDGQRAQVRDGVYTFELNIGAQKGEKLFSREIFHGLGLGGVSVILSVETEEGEFLSGSPDIFDEKEYGAETAVCTNEARGSFVIGLRLVKNIAASRVRVHWTALRNAGEEKKDKAEKKIFIKPSILELGMRESYYLEAVCSNLADKRIQWCVKDNGGYIDDNGHYTAPNMAGVYEVSAESVSCPGVKASIFVVVRDKNE